MSTDSYKSRFHIVDSFNKDILRLLQYVIDIEPNDAQLRALKNKMLLACKADEEFFIKHCGPYLFKYMDHIVNRNEEFFSTPGFLEQNENLNDQTISNILNLVRQVYTEMDDSDQDKIYEKVKSLLLGYLKFLEIEKQMVSK